MKALTIVILLGLQNAYLPGQTPRSFEVASVKVSSPNAGGVSGGCRGIDSTYSPVQMASAPPLGRCVISNGRLSHLLGIAFGFKSLQFLKGGPDWARMGDLRFNIDAKAEDPQKTTEAQLLTMLQNLLVERFGLKYHREDENVAGFAMLVAKNGPKLKATKAEEPRLTFSPDFKPSPGQPTTLRARDFSMPALATLFTQIGPRPVADETGLTGGFDFEISWDDTNGPSLVTAVQEQLGLRLESEKVPVSLFVIDSAEKPTEN